MLDDIHLTPKELEMLERAAEHVGANLVTDYRGPFRPAGQAESIALLCPGPGSLVWFGGVLGLCLDIDKRLLDRLISRIQEAPCGDRRVYYWPGILAPAPGAEPADNGDFDRVMASLGDLGDDPAIASRYPSPEGFQ
jgi:hypothetical protein